MQVIGRISIVQEQRFHVMTDDGRGLLLTLSARAPRSTDDLQCFRQAQERIRHPLLSGPPRSGKMLPARTLPANMPPLSRPKTLEPTKINSVSGMPVPET